MLRSYSFRSTHPRLPKALSEPAAHFVYGTVNTRPALRLQSHNVVQTFFYSQLLRE